MQGSDAPVFAAQQGKMKHIQLHSTLLARGVDVNKVGFRIVQANYTVVVYEKLLGSNIP